MIRTSRLHGKAVVDVESATKLGEVDELFLDLERRVVAGLAVSRGGTLLGGDERLLLPASAIQSIGDDAVMVASGHEASGIELTTRASTLAGRPLVTETGTHLGHVDDVLYDEQSRQIVGYAFAERDESRGPDFAGLFGMGKRRDGDDDSAIDYVRATADLKFGGDLVVVPDHAVVRNETLRGMRTTESVTVTRTTPATRL